MLSVMKIAVAVFAAALFQCGTAAAGDPRLPAGEDPGGTAIALVGGGVDYTSAKIAPRVARDGEAELIGWDLIDNDRTPYASAGGATDAASSDNSTALAEMMLATYAKGRLIPVRVPAGNPDALARAIAFVASTPARVVAITQQLENSNMRMVIRQAAERFKDRVFVVAADMAGLSAGQGAAAKAGTSPPVPSPDVSLMNLGNVLVVMAFADAQGKAAGQISVVSDVVVMARGGSMFGGLVGGSPRNGGEAVALAAASVACQGHGREALVGSAAKAATLDAARPMAQTPAVRALDPMCWYGGVRF